MMLTRDQTIAIYREILGDPNPRLSSRDQLRFGSRGSVAVELAGKRAGAWFDHEANTGGGALDLIRERLGLENPAAIAWLRDRGADLDERRDADERRVVATYDYHDEAGELLMQVVRYAPKDFRQRRPDGRGGWSWSTKGLRFVPYRLPELVAAIGNRTVFVTEGEKDVDALRKLGLVATCNPGGACKWPDHFRDWFRGADVVVLPDADEAGRRHAEIVAANLTGAARSVRVVDLPGVPPKGDASDWIAAGGTADALMALVNAPTETTADDMAGCFRLFDLDALDALVPPEWLISEIIAESSGCLIYGPPGSFKSFVALSWALSIAYGMPWHGRAVKPGAVLYVAAEGVAGYKRRVGAWRREHGVEDQPAPFALLPGAVTMTDPAGEDVQKLLVTAERYAKAAGPLRLVVIDTLARCMAGADEDRASDMGAFVRCADLIREKTGAAVLIVHHSGKDKDRGPRGSIALPGAVDALYEVIRDPEQPVVTLRCTKQKDAPEAEPMTLEAVTVDVPCGVTGEIGTSLVLRPSGRAGVTRKVEPTGHARFALEVLRDLLARSGKPAPKGTADRIPAGVIVGDQGEWRDAYSSKRVADEKPETARKAFYRAATWLQDRGHVGKWGDYVWLIAEKDN